jgi:hypothetical protein
VHQSAVPSPIAHDAALTNLTAIGQDAFAAMAAFIREQQAMAEAQQDRMLHLLREQHEQQRQEIERHRSAADALRTQAAERKMWEGQLTMLQTRLQSLHSAKLLTDDELYRCEDILADGVETTGGHSPEGEVASEQVAKMVALSERLGGDATLARQLRRKFAV